MELARSAQACSVRLAGLAAAQDRRSVRSRSAPPQRRRSTHRRSRALAAAFVIHELQRYAERRLRHGENEADLAGVELALQGDASACQFGLGIVEVVDFNPEMADYGSLAILEPRHAETRLANLDQLQ